MSLICPEKHHRRPTVGLIQLNKTPPATLFEVVSTHFTSLISDLGMTHGEGFRDIQCDSLNKSRNPPAKRSAMQISNCEVDASDSLDDFMT